MPPSDLEVAEKYVKLPFSPSFYSYFSTILSSSNKIHSPTIHYPTQLSFSHADLVRFFQEENTQYQLDKDINRSPIKMVGITNDNQDFRATSSSTDAAMEELKKHSDEVGLNLSNEEVRALLASISAGGGTVFHINNAPNCAERYTLGDYVYNHSGSALCFVKYTKCERTGVAIRVAMPITIHNPAKFSATLERLMDNRMSKYLTQAEANELITANTNHYAGLSFLQGGGVRGGVGIMLSTLWMTEGFKLVIKPSLSAQVPLVERVIPDKDGVCTSLKISLNGISTVVDAEEGEPCFSLSYSASFLLEQEGDVFHYKVLSTDIFISERGWNEHILKKARQILDATEFSDKDCFHLIPCLIDQDFAKAFDKKLSEQAKFISADRWQTILKYISLCPEVSVNEHIERLRKLCRDEMVETSNTLESSINRFKMAWTNFQPANSPILGKALIGIGLALGAAIMLAAASAMVLFSVGMVPAVLAGMSLFAWAGAVILTGGVLASTTYGLTDYRGKQMLTQEKQALENKVEQLDKLLALSNRPSPASSTLPGTPSSTNSNLNLPLNHSDLQLTPPITPPTTARGSSCSSLALFQPASVKEDVGPQSQQPTHNPLHPHN